VLEDPDGWRSVSRLSLELRSVGPEAAGNYTCLARGVKQKIEVNFSIEILGIYIYTTSLKKYTCKIIKIIIIRHEEETCEKLDGIDGSA